MEKKVFSLCNFFNFLSFSFPKFGKDHIHCLPFLKDVKFPMVCCNIDDSALPSNERISDHIEKSVIIELNDRKIGIIGYVTPETTVNIKTNSYEIKGLSNDFRHF